MNQLLKLVKAHRRALMIEVLLPVMITVILHSYRLSVASEAGAVISTIVLIAGMTFACMKEHGNVRIRAVYRCTVGMLACMMVPISGDIGAVKNFFSLYALEMSALMTLSVGIASL